MSGLTTTSLCRRTSIGWMMPPKIYERKEAMADFKGGGWRNSAL
jgi:hypothetical protein